MKMLAFCVYDEKVQAYMAPFFAPTLGHAARSFEDTVTGSQGASLVSKHPEDFSLYHVGEFDEISGELRAQVPVVLVGRGPDFVGRDAGVPGAPGANRFDVVRSMKGPKDPERGRR